ncbi:3'(2'),5'-bisphosphate nucleotidase CysQ [Motiliproteus sediminis]|uniref:3'(2'),5'-bisphosphate nucleotidase CysQ n=1 Tax=Motiliproteus sediminis TaxID=1468178 RepID=UPI001AEFC8F1
MKLDCCQLRPQVVRIAREAGAVILAFYEGRRALSVEQKANDTPLTAADLAAHDLICASLAHLTPDLPVLSEESPPAVERRQWRRYWLVDPLDGTKEFLKRNGEFTVNIALIDDGVPVLGVVHVPVSGSTYSSESRHRAFKQIAQGREQQIHTRPLNRYKPLDVVVSRSHADPRLEDCLAPLTRIAPISMVGVGSSLKLCLIAEGLADLHLRLGPTSEWDTAAAHAVLEAAGGQVCDLHLEPLRYNQNTSLLNPDFLACGDYRFDWSAYIRPPTGA